MNLLEVGSSTIQSPYAAIRTLCFVDQDYPGFLVLRSLLQGYLTHSSKFIPRQHARDIPLIEVSYRQFATDPGVNKPTSIHMYTAHVLSPEQRPSSKPQRLSPMEIPKLVQMITAHLPLREKLHAQLVNRTWNNHTTYTPEESGKRLKYAVREGYTSAVERILKDQRVGPSADDNYAIRKACKEGHLAIVEQLLQDPHVDPSAYKNAAIQMASRNGHLAIVEQLLQDTRVDPSADDNFAIELATYFSYSAVVEQLLQDPRVDPSDNFKLAILCASTSGYLEIVELHLQDPRVDPSAADNYAIRQACNEGYLAIVGQLLQDPRVDPSIRDASSLEHLHRWGLNWGYK